MPNDLARLEGRRLQRLVRLASPLVFRLEGRRAQGFVLLAVQAGRRVVDDLELGSVLEGLVVPLSSHTATNAGRVDVEAREGPEEPPRANNGLTE